MNATPETFGLPQEVFGLGLGLTRVSYKIINPSGEIWSEANGYPFDYGERLYLLLHKGKSVKWSGNRLLIEDDPAVYIEPKDGGIHMVQPGMQCWLRPGLPNELTSVLPLFLPVVGWEGKVVNATFFQYVDWETREESESPYAMTSYWLNWMILQDTDGNGVPNLSVSQKVGRHNKTWLDPKGMRLGMTVNKVLTAGKPVWSTTNNSVKVMKGLPCILGLKISTSHDLIGWEYWKEI